MIRRILLIVVVAFALLLIVPLAWTARTSLMGARGRLKIPPSLMPSHMTVENYIALIMENPTLRWTANSIIVVVPVLGLGLCINTAAGYALEKRRVPGAGIVFGAFIGSMMIPGAVTLVPSLLLIRSLRLYNTMWALIIPGIMSPFLIFFYRHYLRGFPDDFLDAGEVDGAGELYLFFRILVPLTAPAIATMAIMMFMGTWGNFLWQLAAVSKIHLRTLPVGMAILSRDHDTHGEFGGPDYGLMCAGAIYTFVPMLLVFLAAQRHFLTSLEGGVK